MRETYFLTITIGKEEYKWYSYSWASIKLLIDATDSLYSPKGYKRVSTTRFRIGTKHETSLSISYVKC